MRFPGHSQGRWHLFVGLGQRKVSRAVLTSKEGIWKTSRVTRI
jgi:hypothetical protein